MSTLLSVTHVLQSTRGQLLHGLDQRPVAACTIDSRAVGPDGLFFALPGRNTDGHHFLADAARRGAAGAVVSRDAPLPPDLPEGFALVAVRDVPRALYELAAWYRRRLVPKVVAITGSCGKSTTKELLRGILSVAGRTAASPGSYNNHLGVPLSILGAPPDTEYLVLEMGMNAPGEISALTRLAWPDVGVITSVGPAHLEKLGSVEGVAAAKAEIFEGLAPGGLAVLPAGCEHTRKVERTLRDAGRRVRTFGPGGDLAIATVARGPGPGGRAGEAPTDGLSVSTSDGVRWWIPGRSRAAATCALAAITVARALGVDDAQIAAGLATFSPLPMRQRYLELAAGVIAIDDCYNANPLSMQAALEQLGFEGAGRRRVAVLGQMCELGSASAHWHALVGKAAGQAAHVVWAVGEESRPLAAAAAAEGADVRYGATAAEVALHLGEAVRAGDAVLVKGSRAVALESVTAALERMFPRPGRN